MMNYSCVDYVNQAPGLALLKNVNSEIIACSPAMATLLGFQSPDAIAGSTDFDLRCDAAKGAHQFVLQDQEALARGDYKAIDIYRYADGEVKIIFHEKKALIINNELIGISFSGHELTQLHQLSQYFFSLLKSDTRFLRIDQSKAASYAFYETYPNSKLTPKESLCLYYVLRGKSNREISDLVNLSCRTIEGKITSIKHKLGCSTRNQLIEKGLSEGYLTIILKQLLRGNGISISLV